MITELDQLLLRTLPEYMIPAALIRLPQIPRTPNGKVDRKALPQLSANDQITLGSKRNSFTAPVTAEEKQLAAIWSSVLELNEVSITESIFELGADSLLIFRIAARAQREGLPVTATLIFQHRTIRALCMALQQTQKTALPVRSGSRIAAAARDQYRHTRVKLDA